MKTTVYSSDKRTHFFKELKEILKDIRKSNFLSFQMTKRDLQAQYRQSLFGFFWAFAPIIANSLVWIFLQSSGTINLQQPDIPYPLFVIIGTTLWTVFLESLQSPINSVNAGKSIMSKINFPKETLIISGIYKMGFNLGLKLVLIAFFLILYQVNPFPYLLYFPLFLLAIVLLGSSIGLLIAPIGLLYTDVSKLLNMAFSFLMYATPVVYMVPKNTFFKIFFDINPLTYLITGGRNSLTGLPVEHITFAIVITAVSFAALLLGLVIFRKTMPILIEKIS